MCLSPLERVPHHNLRKHMTLVEYFKTEPYGSKKEMAEFIGVSPTWLGLLLNGTRKPSAKLAKKIEKATQGLVKREELRPDLFD